MKKSICKIGVMSMVVALCAGNSFAELTATAMPKTVQDTTFPQRNEQKQEGYKPYMGKSAYEIPRFLENDDEFKDALCARDKQECCRRWPDYKHEKDGKIIFSCQPSISYHLFGGDETKCTDITLPKFYYTDQGATVSCIPTRGGKSQFTGWCPTPDRTKCGTPDCPMLHNIPVGDKDDKIFWACWDCLPPATKKGEQCVCPDPNMDDNCQCSGLGMIPDPTDPNKCVCKAARVAHIDAATQQCVCNNPSLDINTDCTTPKDPCPDARMDPNTCECLPVGSQDLAGVCTCVDNSDVADPNQEIVGATPGTCECKDPTVMEKDLGTGRCVCQDRTIDINTNPTCKTEEYVLIQCRTTRSPSKGFGIFNSVNSIITTLGCDTSTQRTIDKCFTQCSNGSPSLGAINKDIEPGLGSKFCAGRWASSMPIFEFRDYSDQTTVQKYSKSQIDAGLSRLTSTRYSDCDTIGIIPPKYWFIFAYKIDPASGKYEYYIHKQIGR